MTFSGRHTFLCSTTVHVERHRGPTLLRKRCELVMLIETGLSLRPREVVHCKLISIRGFHHSLFYFCPTTMTRSFCCRIFRTQSENR